MKAHVSERSLNLSYDEKLDHVRFLAALIILVNHAFNLIFTTLSQIPVTWTAVNRHTQELSGAWLVLKALVMEGHIAIGLFFTLSGFLFARITAGADIMPGKFLLNRILRIYPLYLTFVLLALCLTPPANPLLALSLSILTLQNLPQATYHGLLTPHLWSIAVEFQLYLLFPVLLSGYRARGMPFLLLVLLVSIALKILAFSSLGGVQDLCYRTALGRFDQFIIGMMLGFSFQRFRHRFVNPGYACLALLAVGIAVTGFHVYGGFGSTEHDPFWIVCPAVESALWGAFLFAYCACNFRFPEQISRIFAFLGGISYSLYLNHFPLCILMAGWLGSPLHGLNERLLVPVFGGSQLELFLLSVFFALAVVLPGTIALSCLTYYLIEKPFLDRRVRYVRGDAPIDKEAILW
jgi:peptidoglycan/LPS O-acetylase OafA/YrhL